MVTQATQVMLEIQILCQNNAIEILSNENLKKKFKSQAFENATKYDIKKVIPLYEDVYKKAIS